MCNNRYIAAEEEHERLATYKVCPVLNKELRKKKTFLRFYFYRYVSVLIIVLDAMSGPT